jgi:Uma2 family endonuclease
MSQPHPRKATIVYEVPIACDDWTLSEVTLPESQTHDLTLDLLKALLLAWAERRGIAAQVARNLAVRWDETRPQIGVDPDLCVITPRTPEGDALTSLCTWKPGHAPPVLAIEVVSENNPRKDYVSAPDKYAACGARELWIVDPLGVGPTKQGSAIRLQVWRRGQGGELRRVYAGDGPVWSEEVQGFLFVVADGERLRIADDEAGTRWWTTREEGERAAKEQERADKVAALARVAELEAELAKARGETAR